MEVALAGVIFLVTYALIATDRVDKTVAALLGGSLVVILGIVDQEEAFAAIDLNVIFLLAGMMILAGILRQTGFFQWVAIRSVKWARGEPYRLLLILSVVTAILSAFLDNVTTVVLLAPVTLYIANVLRVSPLPFLISEILASQHRWCRDTDRRSPEHPHRLSCRPRVRRFPGQHGTGGCAGVRCVPGHDVLVLRT